MKKRNRYKKNAYKFHRLVLSRKNNKSKRIVAEIECKLRRRFGLYKHLMNEDQLEKLTHLKLTDERKEALKDLYSFSSKSFRELYTELTTDAHNRKSNLCPYCLLELTSTLDHIIPKTPFPEYSTHPYNLIPCCSTCNSKKNDIWQKDGKRIILNFYIDVIPDIQVLYAEPLIANNRLKISYRLRFPDGYNPLLKNKIENHFSKLELLRRYQENSDDKIDELLSNIRNFMDVLDDTTTKEVIRKNAYDLQSKYGKNYWVSILNLACIDEPQVFNYLKDGKFRSC